MPTDEVSATAPGAGSPAMGVGTSCAGYDQRAQGGPVREPAGGDDELADQLRAHRVERVGALEGEDHCPRDGGRIVQQTLEFSVDRLLAQPAGARAMLLAPWMRARPAVLRDEIAGLRPGEALVHAFTVPVGMPVFRRCGGSATAAGGRSTTSPTTPRAGSRPSTPAGLPTRTTR